MERWLIDLIFSDETRGKEGGPLPQNKMIDWLEVIYRIEDERCRTKSERQAENTRCICTKRRKYDDDMAEERDRKNAARIRFAE